MKFRNIKKPDTGKIIELIKKCQPQLVPHHEYIYWILARYFKSTCFVCEENSQIIGFVGAMPSIDKSSLFVWQICADPDYRRKNVANNLLSKILKSLTKLKLKNIQLSIENYNSPSKNLFKNFAKTNNLTIKKVATESLEKSIEMVYQINI